MVEPLHEVMTRLREYAQDDYFCDQLRRTAREALAELARLRADLSEALSELKNAHDALAFYGNPIACELTDAWEHLAPAVHYLTSDQKRELRAILENGGATAREAQERAAALHERLTAEPGEREG